MEKHDSSPSSELDQRLDLTGWVKAVHDTAHEKGWWPEKPVEGVRIEGRNTGELLMLCASELFEAFEIYRSAKDVHALRSTWVEEGNPAMSVASYGNRIVGENGKAPTIEDCYGLKPEGFGIELADAVIRILDVAGALGIDLEGMIALKAAYNKTRPERHGGKRA